MLDPIEKYLDDIMAHAGLAPGDAVRVRAELKDHLSELIASIGDRPGQTEKEIRIMLENEFGKPGNIGRAIAAGKGRFLSYLKRNRRRWAVKCSIALVLVFSLRAAVAAPYYAPTDVAAPAVPKGSRILVFKLATHFEAGDVIAFRASSDRTALLGIVKSVDGTTLHVQRSGWPDQDVDLSRIIGRVILNTR